MRERRAQRATHAPGALARAQEVDTPTIRSYHRHMPMWRCPHCGTPQAETARCWVCRRSSTACATCRHFRQAVAGSLGYCGLDARRTPLVGNEIRACWEARSVVTEAAPSAAVPLGAGHVSPPPGRPAEAWDGRPNRIEFVEVGARPVEEHRLRRASRQRRPAEAPVPVPDSASEPERASEVRPSARPLATTDEPPWSLWGELD